VRNSNPSRGVVLPAEIRLAHLRGLLLHRSGFFEDRGLLALERGGERCGAELSLARLGL
jgi:hypothetical protein